MGDRIPQLREMDEKFQRLTGREAFGYLSKPTPGTWRYVFQDGTISTTPAKAVDYMSTLLYLAAVSPEKLPPPWDQPLPPEHDLRVINGWDKEARDGES